MSTRRFESLLRWYPPAWRDRYGSELVVLMEDTYGAEKPPLRTRLGIARAGVVQHFGEFGLRSGPGTPEERVRSGSLLVLCAWALFVVAGAGFAKFAEHWDAVTPRGAERLAGDAYNSVQWAAAVGAVLLMAGVAAAVPSLAQLTRDRGWAAIRRPVRRAAAVASTTLVLGVGVIIWAHHLDLKQRNGASLPYELIGLLLAVMVTTTIAVCTAAAVAIGRRIELSPRMLRLEGVLAVLLASAMVAIIGGTLVWWVTIAADAPRFLSGNTSGPVGSPAPVVMIVVGILMLNGLGLAAAGATRVARSTRA